MGEHMGESEQRGAEERIVLPKGGSAALACQAGLVTVSAVDDGSIRVDFGSPECSVMLRITEAIELHDGDLIAAGQTWMSFEAGHDRRPARLHLLDEVGAIHMTLTLRGTSLTLGRTSGDVVLPRDEALSELHLQLLMRGDSVFLQDLASSNGTWTVVRPGEVLPSSSTLAIGERLVRVSTPPPVGSEPAVADRGWRTSVHVAA
ncbi:MAG: FHA domain-containing protein [Myxococcales bacterium]|nr:FHA domain-containing protein [Myxococcales bacterium]